MYMLMYMCMYIFTFVAYYTITTVQCKYYEIQYMYIYMYSRKQYVKSYMHV